VNEDAKVMIVLCSDGPENGRRVPIRARWALVHDIVMSDELVAALRQTPEECDRGVTRFRWDGTYDEHGDARYRVVE
jgi:hypothetical protein